MHDRGQPGARGRSRSQGWAPLPLPFDGGGARGTSAPDARVRQTTALAGVHEAVHPRAPQHDNAARRGVSKREKGQRRSTTHAGRAGVGWAGQGRPLTWRSATSSIAEASPARRSCSASTARRTVQSCARPTGSPDGLGAGQQRRPRARRDSSTVMPVRIRCPDMPVAGGRSAPCG